MSRAAQQIAAYLKYIQSIDTGDFSNNPDMTPLVDTGDFSFNPDLTPVAAQAAIIQEALDAVQRVILAW